MLPIKHWPYHVRFIKPKQPPDPDLEPVYLQDDAAEGEEVLCGFIKFRETEGSMAGGGWIIYGKNRQPKSLVPTKGEAIATLRAPYLNRKIAADFDEKLNSMEKF